MILKKEKSKKSGGVHFGNSEAAADNGSYYEKIIPSEINLIKEKEEHHNQNNEASIEEEDGNPDYGKGETPLDLFLESSYEEGKKSILDPISVFKPIVEPKISSLRDGD